MDQQEEKFIQMTQPPVGGLILKLAVPCIVSMLVTTLIWRTPSSWEC